MKKFLYVRPSVFSRLERDTARHVRLPHSHFALPHSNFKLPWRHAKGVNGVLAVFLWFTNNPY
jgi:hypothetical protein